MNNPNSRIARKKQKMEQHLFETAVKLFLEKGYDNTTIDDITEEADVSRGTFFNYFPKKYAIIDYSLNNRRKYLRSFAQKESKMSSTDRILSIFKYLVKQNEKEKDYSKVIIIEWVKSGETIDRQPTQDILRDVIITGQETGEFRNDIDANFISQLMTSGVYYHNLFEWVKAECSFSLKRVLKEIETIIQFIKK